MSKPSNRRGRRVDATGHSKGEGKHVRLYDWLLRSNAWRELSPYERCLYIELGGLFNGSNNGEIFMSEREAGKRLGCNPKTARIALKGLVQWGFIRPVVNGSFIWKARHATCWVLTEHSYAGGLPTKDFMKHGMVPQNNSRHQYVGQAAPVGGADAHE